MRVLFMGTPVFAVQSLKALYDAGFEISGVISQPDKPKNRKMKIMPTPVKEYALSKNLKVYQPETLKNKEILPFLEETAPDVIAVVAYGKILPEYVLNFPKYGCINIHASLLPKYRGAAPIHHCLLNGDSVTGVTSMVMDKHMDTGDIILKKEVTIRDEDDFFSLHDILAEEGGRLLVKTLRLLEKGEAKPVKQEDSEATYTSMITAEMGKIDWSMDAKGIMGKVRGLCAWPVAYTYLDGKRFKIHKAELIKGTGMPGEIIGLDGGITVAAGTGAVRILELQFDNKRRMAATEYLAGNKLKIGQFIST